MVSFDKINDRGGARDGGRGVQSKTEWRNGRGKIRPTRKHCTHHRSRVLVTESPEYYNNR